MTHDAKTTESTLNYAPPREWWRRVQWRRWWIWLLPVVLVLTSMSWGPRVWYRAQYKMYQDRLASSTPAAETVILDFAAPPPAAVPAAHAQFWKSQNRTQWLISHERDVRGAVVFAGQMLTSRGHPRIVLIYVERTRTRLTFHAYAVTPRNWDWAVWKAGHFSYDLGSTGFHVAILDDDALVLYAAQRDPVDPLELLIPYRARGKAGLIRARLRCASEGLHAGMVFKATEGALAGRATVAGGGGGFELFYDRPE